MTPNSIFSLLEMASFGAYVMSLDQTILFWNRAAERILGFPAEKVVGRHCYEVLENLAPGGLTPACLYGCPSMRALRAGEIPSTITLRMRCESGGRKLASLTPMVVAGAERQAPLLVHLFNDDPDPAVSDRDAEDVRRDLRDRGANILSDSPTPRSDPPKRGLLSPRELEVLHLVSLGSGTLRIAEELGISPHTVRNHVRNLREKLGADSKLAAVLTAIRRGILDLG